VRSLHAHLALFTVSVIWGLAYLFTKVQLADLGPFEGAAARVWISAALIAPAVVGLPGSGIGIRRGLTLGFLGIAGYYAGFNVGLQTARVSDAGVIQASIPAVSALLATRLLGERPHWRVWVGIALSFAGILTLVTATSAAGQGSLTGDLWIVFSVVAWAIYSVYVRRLGSAYSATALTAATLAWGAVLVLPLAFLELAAVTPRLTLAGAAATLYLAVFAGAIGYWLWSYGLARVPAARATSYLNLLPVVALASGALVLNERVGPTEILSALVIVGGVYLATRGGGR